MHVWGFFSMFECCVTDELTQSFSALLSNINKAVLYRKEAETSGTITNLQSY